MATPSAAYTVVAEAGRGASGVVLEARRSDGATVALKVALAPFARGALAREADVLARVARRWGPRALDAGRMPEGAPHAGAPFLALEWIEGANLARAGAPSRRGERERLVATVAHGVAGALEELHAVGITHGDVKPANIVSSPGGAGADDAAGRGATLLDLDLAATLDEPSPGATPRYLAPEAHATAQRAPAVDLFALGAVLDELLRPGDAPELHAIARALGSPAPGGRPSAAWVRARAAAWLGLSPERRDDGAEARVARAYILARRSRLARGGAASEDLTGAPRRWWNEARAWSSRLAAAFGEGHRDVDAQVGPASPMERAAWLAALVGPEAARWPVETLPPDDALADRLVAVASRMRLEAATFDDLARADGDVSEDGLPSDDLALTRALLLPPVDAHVLDRAEARAVSEGSPPSLAVDVARALLLAGRVGRAWSVLGAVPRRGDAARLRVLAEVERRRGERAAARDAAEEAVRAGGREGASAKAVLARIAWDEGDLSRATSALADARGPEACEVRALIACSLQDTDGGLSAVDLGLRSAPTDRITEARLLGARGLLLHAAGRADESLTAFRGAVAAAARLGAVVDEATYLTGVAAAATDAGDVRAALPAAERAAVLWDRLGRPEQAARAWLSRAAALALVGATHEARVSAGEARARAEDGGDARAAAYARLVCDDDAAELEAALTTLLEAGAPAGDLLRARARLLRLGRGTEGVEASDDAAAAAGDVSAIEWWGARAAAAVDALRQAGASARREPARDVLSRLLALVDAPLPLGSRGPALADGAALAAELGDGDALRRIEAARGEVAERLAKGTPPELRSALAQVRWARAPEPSRPALGAEQVRALEAITRALGSRDRLRPLLEQVLDTMLVWTGVERGLLLLRGADGALVPRVARNLARRDLTGAQLELSMSVAQRALREGEIVCATDAAAQIGDLYASVHALRLRSVLAVPLVARGESLGVVYLDDRVRRGAFGEAEISWIRLVAAQAAHAIADARAQVLLRRAVRRAERAKARLEAALGERDVEVLAMRRTLEEETRYSYEAIGGRAEPMRAMLRLVDRVTASDVPVLLVGESGTGKELVARAIHGNGPRASRPFVSENCGSVPETLLESTLFGHVRGAFTGAHATRAGLFDVANGGTLFLDEIGEMPLSMQTKLLRALQDGEVRPVGGDRTHRVDVRILGATHRDLEAMVADGRFREDLFYRLNVVTIAVPPLRDRREDIPLLVDRFLAKHAPDRRVRVTRAAMDRLVAFPWPGNVRQLENEIRRALVLADDRVDVPDLSPEIGRGGPGAAREAGLGLRARVDALEVELVREALERTKGNQTRAAELLGVSRYGLQKMMKRLGISTGGGRA